MSANLLPSTGKLARWLRSWVHESGAIHGFHNHPVWGGNPYRSEDMSCGHSTFASLLLPALATALRLEPDPRGHHLLDQLVEFQCTARHEEGQFLHIGFEVGEVIQRGMIHNMVPCVSLCATVLEMGDAMPVGTKKQIDKTVRDVLAACEEHCGLEINEDTTSNQAYSRIWAMLLHMEAFGHSDWDDTVHKQLEGLKERFHVQDLPEAGCLASLRSSNAPGIIEPAEYYGLMIHPLLCAAKRYDRSDYLESAKGFARHVIRSAWRDPRGCLRFHRLWRGLGDQLVCIREPMLIGGMGITLSAIQALESAVPDTEWAGFLGEMDQTYVRYQNESGFFLAASGWCGEQDVIPSSAWQSHDLYHLVCRHGIESGFWEEVFGDYQRVAVVLGFNLFWVETSTHWAVRGYESSHGLELAGRKNLNRFGVDIPRWVKGGRHLDLDMLLPDQPKFLRTDEAIIALSGRSDIDLTNASGKNFQPQGAQPGAV